MHWLQLIASGLLSGGASILLKVATTPAVSPEYSTDGLFAHSHLLRIGAIGAYGLGFLLYANALQKLNLAVAYPLMIAVAMLTVVGFTLLTGEALHATHVIGAALIAVGIWLLMRSG